MTDKRIDLFNILRNEGKLTKIKLFDAIETLVDPREKIKSLTYFNPLIIKGYVSPIGFSSLKWKYYGQIPMGSVLILIRKKYKTSIKTAAKIEIYDELFKSYKTDDKGFALKEYNDYIIVILEKIV